MEDLTNTLKRCFSQISTSSQKERVHLMTIVLAPCLQHEGLGEGHLKAVAKILSRTIHRYRDRVSRNAVLQVIESFLKHQGVQAANALISEILRLAENLKRTGFSAPPARTALTLLSWMRLILSSCYGGLVAGESFQSVVVITGLLISRIYVSGHSRISYKAYKVFAHILNKCPGLIEKLLTTASNSEKYQLEMLCFIGVCIKYLSAAKEINKLDQCKVKILDSYVKTLLNAKTATHPAFMNGIGLLLKHVSHDEFKSVLLPAVQKALLRNPEAIAQAVCDLFSHLRIDLSQYAVEIGKSLSPLLTAQQEELRCIAVKSFENVSHQCSDADAVENIIEHLTSVLYGSEGKLTKVEQRMAVLSALSAVHNNSVSGKKSQERLALVLYEKMTKFLGLEGHEGTLVEALKLLKIWTADFTSNAPKDFPEVLKRGISVKSATPLIRTTYFQIASSIYSGNTLNDAIPLIDLLMQHFDKVKTQSQVVNTVTESLSAAVLLVNISTLDDVSKVSKLTTFWESVLDPKKAYFTSVKFVNNASDQGIELLVAFMKSLFSSHFQLLNEANARPWYHMLLLILLHPSWRLRKEGVSLMKAALASPHSNAIEIQSSFLKEFREILLAHKVMKSSELDISAEKVAEKITYSKYQKTLADAFKCIVLAENADLQNGRENICLEILIDAHRPAIVSEEKNLWERFLKLFKIDAKSFIKKHIGCLLQMVKEGEVLSEAQSSAFATILKLAPEEVLPLVFDECIEQFNNPHLKQVTAEEHNIMLTPEGEVYDKTIISSAKAEIKNKNVKRESKAYSFKEQKLELELQEELRKKKGIKAENEKPNLTKKQQEMLAEQMQREKEIRTKLREMEANLVKYVSLMKIMTQVSPSMLAEYVSSIQQCLMGLMTSPLAAPVIVPLYISLKDCVFEDDLKHLGNLVAYVSLRQLKPACAINDEWCAEDLTKETIRAVEALHTFATTRNVAILMTYTRKRLLSSAALAFCLPLLRSVLQDQGSRIKGEEKTRQEALQLMLLHCKRRRTAEEAQEDIMQVDWMLLPRLEMLSILSDVVVEAEGHNKEAKIQHSAATCIVEVCKSEAGILDDGLVLALTNNLISASSVLRHYSLEGLRCLIEVFPDAGTTERDLLVSRVLSTKFDSEKHIAELAETLWEEAELSITPTVCIQLLDDVVLTIENSRVAASSALSAALEEHPMVAPDVRDQLMALYEEYNKVPIPQFDSLGRISSAPFIDKWEARAGIGLAFAKIVKFIPSQQIEDLFKFFVPDILGDRNEIVRKQMLDAAVSAINEHGKENITELLKIFDQFLENACETSSHDIIRQSVIILLGSLAKHLDKTDPKIKPIIAKLMDALSTPSLQVQEAVASCLPPLCSAIKEEAPGHVKRLLETLLNADKYGERRGAAYGLAGMVKGLGIMSLKQQEIISALTTAIQDKKNYKHREGALFAFETLCNMLGRLFEPYVVHLLPHLLLCFGDGNQYVREAADETAKAVMRNLSAHGVKLVLPSLVKALEEDSWRTKTGSVELLGAMAYCAPKQLSSCLPSVVPKLIEVLADPHFKVQKAAQQALKQIGSVIRNPEIQEISPIILAALADSGKNTVPCLQALLNTSFVHFIDAPSLAIIMPILEKAMQQRATETKKMAAQIIGNMYALTDQKDLAPYLPAVVPGLKKSLLDPSPDVRGVSARALGAMVKGMGEESFNDLLPWLLETLTSEQSSVDRSGAAQGLAEVLHGLGSDRLDKLMPDVIEMTSKEDLAPHVREGYLMLYIYLPATFGEVFASYIGPIVPSLLKGLADEAEFVRATSLKAGQRIIATYSDTAVTLFLPELEKGLFDDHWRIRFSSIQLLGDLLFKVTGVSGKQTTHGDEDDNFGTAQSTKAIVDLLGIERRNHVLSGLYMGRSDVALGVRQASLHVWKVVVHNTAKTLREILPTLFKILLGCLASTSYDKRQTAGRTLGDLVRKLGERVLPEIIPILERGLDSERSDERQGVCIGLSEIVNSTSRDMIMMFEDSLINTVKRALLDPLSEVREAAAEAFNRLHDTIGQKALDGILPHVLEKLNDVDCADRALDGLRNVMTVKSRVVLPFLVPKLTVPPVNTRALAILSTVAGDALTRHLCKILPAMFQAMEKSADAEQEQQAIEGTRALILSVDDDNGVAIIVDELISSAKHNSPGIRKASAIMLKAFCSKCKADYTAFIQQLLQIILQLMNDQDSAVYTEAWGALDALIKRLEPSEQMQHIGNLRKAIRFAADDAREGRIPGFCIVGKGINAIFPVYKEGILNGGPELREHAAKLLGEVVCLTSAEALKSSLLNVTGPLIRIFGDRFSWNVKAAILQTLILLLKKVGIMLKPVLPQLQTTFIKALNDKTLAVREKAVEALTLFTTLHTKVDLLFTELRNGVKNNEDNTIRESILKALRSMTLTAGSKMSEAVRKSLTEALVVLLGSAEDELRVSAGGAVGALTTVMSEYEVKDLLDSELLEEDDSLDWTIRHGRTVALSYAIFDAPEKLHEIVGNDVITDSVLKQAGADRIPILMYGIHSIGHLMISNALIGHAIPSSLLAAMKKSFQHQSNDVKLTAINTMAYVSTKTPSAVETDALKSLLPELVACSRDRNTTVRNASESALVSVLALRDGEEKYKESLEVSSSDVAEKLKDSRRGVLSKLLQSYETFDEYPFTLNSVLK